jgi:hypothetical protein
LASSEPIAKIAQDHERFFFGDISNELRDTLMKAFRALCEKGEPED